MSPLNVRTVRGDAVDVSALNEGHTDTCEMHDVERLIIFLLPFLPPTENFPPTTTTTGPLLPPYSCTAPIMPSPFNLRGLKQHKGRSSPPSTDHTVSSQCVTVSEKDKHPFAMDLLHMSKNKHHGVGSRSSSKEPKDKSKGSPKTAPTRPAKLVIDYESPPLVFYGSTAQSSGALLSAQLILDVTDPSVKLQTYDLALCAKVTTKKPVEKTCPDCKIKTRVLKKWTFISEPTKYDMGTHEFPFSYLLPGDLPATTHGVLGSIEYILYAHATTSLSESIAVDRTLHVQRALMPGPDRNSVRVFPPTNLNATVALPSIIHPIGGFNVQLRLTGVVERGKDQQHRWRIRKMNWRIDETSRIISAACPKHAAKIGGEGKGVQHEDVREIGGADIKKGWKTDFDTAGGQIDIEFPAAIKPGAHPICDVESPNFTSATHAMVLEIVVAEEYCSNKNPKLVTPTGGARVLRMSFKLTLTERAGMGISWDEEMPPMYDDVPSSPPGYLKVEDREGEMLPYEDLEHLETME